MAGAPSDDDIDEEVVLVDYEECWPNAFAPEATRLRSELHPNDRIDHIGSTAVPGCRSKPIVDIQIIVPREEMERVVEAAQRLGYVGFADESIPERIYLRLRDGRRRFNVQVIDSDTTLADDNVALREYLRANPDARARYQAAKDAAAAAAPRLRGYSEAKAAEVHRLIALARRSKSS